MLKFGGRLLVARGFKALQEAVHRCTIDGRTYAEMSIGILQSEFLVTMGWAGLVVSQLPDGSHKTFQKT
jgi:hypothetical protein